MRNLENKRGKKYVMNTYGRLAVVRKRGLCLGCRREECDFIRYCHKQCGMSSKTSEAMLRRQPCFIVQIFIGSNPGKISKNFSGNSVLIKSFLQQRAETNEGAVKLARK